MRRAYGTRAKGHKVSLILKTRIKKQEVIRLMFFIFFYLVWFTLCSLEQPRDGGCCWAGPRPQCRSKTVAGSPREKRGRKQRGQWQQTLKVVQGALNYPQLEGRYATVPFHPCRC